MFLLALNNIYFYKCLKAKMESLARVSLVQLYRDVLRHHGHFDQPRHSDIHIDPTLLFSLILDREVVVIWSHTDKVQVEPRRSNLLLFVVPDRKD